MALGIWLFLTGIILVNAQDDKIIFPDRPFEEVAPPTKEANDDIYYETDPYQLSTDAIYHTPTESSAENTPRIDNVPRIDKEFQANATKSATYLQQKGVVAYNTATIPKCPEGLQYYENKQNMSFCVFITEPSSFPPLCPYPNYVEYYFLKSEFALNVTNEAVWSYGMRNNSEDRPSFLWIDLVFNLNSDHREVIPNEFIDNYYDIRDESCLVLDGSYLMATNCTEKHPGICIYTYDSYISPFYGYVFDYCKSRYDETCFSSSLGSDLTCYCINRTQLDNQTRSTFCGKLAELKNPYESFILTQHISSETCWIGLGQDETGRVQWSTTGDVLNYTYWSKFANFGNNYGAISNNGWLPENDGSLNCAVCQFDPEGQQIQLQLKQNEANYKIELEVIDKANELQRVICFTENNMTVFDLPSKTQSVAVIQVWKSTNIKGFCWCRTFHISTRRYINSNIVYTNKTNTKLEYLSDKSTCSASVTVSGNMILHWPETNLGATAIPEELCLQEDGSPVTRSCGGEATFSSNWMPVSGTCAAVTFSPRTLQLDELLRSMNVSFTNLTSNLLHITEDTNNVTSFQIHLVSKVLEKASGITEPIGETVVKEIVTTVNNVMHYDPSRLKEAQKLLNSTDMILCSLDDLLKETDTGSDGFASEVTEKLLIQVSNLRMSSVTGIKLRPLDANGFDSSKVEPLQRSTPEDELLKENLELAMFTPSQLYDDIMNCPGSRSSPKIVTAVFYDDILFNQPENETGKTDGRIISVTIPGFNCPFTAPIQIIFKATNNSEKLKCGSWVYGSNTLNGSIHGYWSAENEPKTVDGYQMCEFSHVTHFSLLVLGGRNISEGHKKALDIITAVGSGLSILGLIIVFLTAILFKSYRSANGVVINFSLAMTAQIVLLFIADNVGEDRVMCIIFGAALHYIVLSQFCWMLTIAVLQYRRYVVVFANPTPYLVTKTCVFAWGVPLIPIIVIVSISTDNYGPNSYGLCYALGNYFIFGVLLPVSLIVLINLIVFLRIMVSIASSRRVKVHQVKDDTSILQLRLAFMLYFLLGLTWGFGLLAAIGGGVVYSYLFCLTATLQGFVLFLFFIVLNEKTRSLWINITTCCGKTQADHYGISGDSAATAMMRRPRNTASSDACTDSTSSDMLRRIRNRSSSDF